MKLHEAWFHEATKLKPGEELYVQAENKDVQKRLYFKFMKEKDKYNRIDPITSAKIEIIRKFKDGKHWIIMKMTALSPQIGFKKDKDGQLSKVVLPADIVDKNRRIRLMVKDHMTISEIEEVLGEPLTEEEKDNFIP